MKALEVERARTPERRREGDEVRGGERARERGRETARETRGRERGKGRKRASERGRQRAREKRTAARRKGYELGTEKILYESRGFGMRIYGRSAPRSLELAQEREKEG